MSLRWIKSQELYNALNQLQSGGFSQLSDPNYLLLIDARSMEDYLHYHIPTAIRPRGRVVKNEETGETTTTMVLPYEPAIEAKQRIVVYDGDSKELSIDVSRPAVRVATALSRAGAQVQVEVLYGGFEEFSACYPFMRTTKTVYTQRELDDFETYPVDVIVGCMYLGMVDQACDYEVRKNLKLSALVLFHDTESKKEEAKSKLPVDVAAVHNVGKVTMEKLKDICQFIDKHRLQGERVLLACKAGRAHCVSSAVAYLMHERAGKMSKIEALKVVQKCRNDVIMNGEWLRVINK
jgi:serine/threonine/tyrosine-interacting-like protein 1